MTIIAIIIGLAYTTILVLNIVKLELSPDFRKTVSALHLTFFLLTVTDIILLATSGATFRGVYFDRFIALGLLISGGLYFALFKGKTIWAKLYFGIYLFYPAVAMITFLFDRIMFAVFAGPILISLTVPDIYYKDNNFELRSRVGVLAGEQMILIEKSWLTEKEIGRAEPVAEKITRLEIVNRTPNSIQARLYYEGSSELVEF